MQSKEEWYREQRSRAEAAERTILEILYKYLLFTNAGGVAILLAFTSAHRELLKDWAWLAAIVSFLVGIVLTGLYAYAALAHTHGLIDDLDEYIAGDGGPFNQRRGKIAKAFRPILGWSAFLAFILGCSFAISVAFGAEPYFNGFTGMALR